ncbi:Nitrate reductase [NADH] 1 [Fusarium oxysporum f. sp. cubense race 1]|uniref:Nitrate reductase [NADPH] n=1 Tax=Fusarium oxysporum f. sp. cubense (strain race 1) TaxID=1229664 RepID=N4TNJ9_FUSC1|nr:Nitrate reductase [NADH] 1 [Fusarium oxysporum f. sp. cubense race 1]
MPHSKPWVVKVQAHPGSTAEEIRNEPDWVSGHQHRIGFRDRNNRLPGLTHKDDEYREEVAREKQNEEANSFKDFHLRHPENRSLGWRYVLNATEDWVKNKEPWPANLKKQEEEERKKKEEEAKSDNKNDTPEQEHEWKRSSDKDKHHDAYAKNKENEEKKQEKTSSEKPTLSDKYTPAEIALLRALEHEKNYIQHLKENNGKRKSPQHKNLTQISIDEQDQFSPDNWLPRSPDLIRLTGKHPLNAEAPLTRLYEAGLITPNELHYVRNHGPVPRILWEFHELEITYDGETQTLSMDDLKEFDTINIAVALACDGNRRKELNMIKKSKGFNWGAGGASCAYWKGPLLRDVLLANGVPEKPPGLGEKRYWVNFEGTDDLSEGNYATCIPFEHAMSPNNDVILAYEMNDVPLPPDHGYPVRVIIPGYVGGRNVKWLKKIWISEKENDSYYHIWDNRVLPSFVTEKDGPFAEALFHHPDTACNEQNLNSIIVKPAQGERILLGRAKKGENYRIEGYAYDGGGHEVQRVEVSLDDGATWLYCIRKFPDYPIRHGNKFWSWLHWHVDVEISHVIRAKSIMVRCFNVFKNTQPREPNWNVMGMMNNCWYTVRPEITEDDDSETPSILFRHPVEPATKDGGWMEPSVENKIAEAKQEAGAPQKEFTREEIEKHNTQDDCWLVVDGKVYDATSVLGWHPGGTAAILGHAGKVHQETSDEFAKCALGVVTEKAANFIKQNAEAAAKDTSRSSNKDEHLALEKHRWIPVKLIDRKNLSKDTRAYTFQLPEGKSILGLGTCQHVQIGFHMLDRMLIRSYTPTKPLLPAPGDNMTNGSAKSLRDGDATFELTVKTYFPDENQPGGALSNILDCMPIGEEVELRGPTGEIVYNGNGDFVIEGKDRHFDRVSLVLGGSGITPGYSLLARILLSNNDKTEVRVVDANKTEADILLKEELEDFETKAHGQLKKAALPALKDWGYVEDENMFGF